MIANLTHFDLDGVVSHILLRNVFPKKDIRYYSCGYEKLPKKIEKLIADRQVFGIDTLFITDLSINVEQAKLLKENIPTIFLLDHHETSFAIKKELKEILPNVCINRTMCASSIVFTSFEKQLEYNLNVMLKDLPEMASRMSRLKRLVELTNIYDMWQSMNPDFSTAYYLNDTFWIYRWDAFISRFFGGFEGFSTYESSTVYGRLQERLKLIDEAEKTIFPEEKKNAVFVISTEADRITNEITISMKNYEYFFIFNPEIDKLSIRARKNNVNIAEVLKNIKSEIVQESGGHRFAGGVVLKMKYEKADLEQLVNDIYEKLEMQCAKK